MSKFIFNNKGFIFIETIFLALILSFTAMLILNQLEPSIKSNRMSMIREAAIYLANAKMSEIEEYNDKRSSFQLPTNTFLTYEDLTYKDFLGINDTIKFEIETITNTATANHGNITVKVTWIVNGNENYGTGNNYEEITKDIWILQTE